MHLFRELKRRNVFRVGLAYLVGAWLVAQVMQLAVDSFAAPDWIMKLLIVVLVIGFPAVILFSWAYELTPEGLRRESDVAPDASITHHTAKRLDLLTIVLVVLAVAFVIWARQMPPSTNVVTGPASTESTAGAVGEPAAADRSIAVLPFVNMSDDPENEYFADGLSEELLNRLAQLPELRVAGRTSSFEYKGQNLDLREIARKLGVSNILEGSVRRSADRVRITAQLIRASDGSHLWSQSYDRTIEDIFATQDEIAERVAANLDVVMDDERRELMRRVGVRDVDAFVAYQKGWKILVDGHASEPDLRTELGRANAYFRQAIESFPGFFDAWYWQADLYQHILMDPDSSQADLEMAAAENDRILSAASENAQSPRQRAFTNVTRAVFSSDWTGIQMLHDRALSLQTCTGPNWSELLFPLGREQAGARQMEVFQNCVGKLGSVVEYQRMLEALLLTGRKEEALALIDQAISELGHSVRTGQQRVKALLALGRTEEATEEAKLMDRTDRRFGQTLAATYAAAGRFDEADREADAWLALEGIDEMSVLEVLAFLGRRDEANARAAAIDRRPGGHLALAGAILHCLCGAVFDIEATPNFGALLAQGELRWPPTSPIPLPARTADQGLGLARD